MYGLEIFTAVMAFVFGSAMGSFLNVVILRLPGGKSLGGRSHCGSCGKTLKALDLIPLVSFLFLRGRCRYCGAKISPRYFIIEALTGLLFAFLLLNFFPVSPAQGVLLAKFLALLCIVIVVFVVDLEHYVILSNVLLVGTGLVFLADAVLDFMHAGGAEFAVFHSYVLNGLLGAAVCFLPFFLAWAWPPQGTYMGFGDVELAPFLGLALGWPLGPLAIFIAILLGGIVGIFLILRGKKTLKSRIPFGTFLSVAAIISLFYGDKLLHWYLFFLGF